MAEGSEMRQLIAETGRMLLDQTLVARTWGNISGRIDQDTFAISPSGLDYLHTEAEDIPIVNRSDLTWEGIRKPSSEIGIHAAAYEIFEDVNFVIHTHQKFATALSLGGFDNDSLEPAEKEVLGCVTTAAYALPGTGKLTANVADQFRKGSKVVLMAHHGVVICGADRDDAMKKALLLEDVCRQQIRGMDPDRSAGRQYAKLGIPLPAQLDDMAQMIGRRIPVVTREKYTKKRVESAGALLVRDYGIKVYSKDEGDREALKLLAEKAAVSALHARALGIDARLSGIDALIMRAVYQLKYSKQKKG